MGDTTTDVTEEDRAALEALKAADIEYRVVPIGLLQPNPWNPNRMDERTRAAARKSIELYGFIDPPLVRPHPDGEQFPEETWQIIDGEHRVAEAVELGIERVPITIVKLDDVAAEKLTVIFNDTRGEHDDVLLGNLLAQIKARGGEDWAAGLRYTDSQTEHLLGLATEDWGAYQPPDPDDQAPPAAPPAAEPEMWQGWTLDDLAALLDPGEHQDHHQDLLDQAKDVVAGRLGDEGT